MFYSFDGIDGVGKTTQIELFSQWLSDTGQDVVIFRDPGGTELSEKIRDILLQKSGVPISNRTEMMLYMASRTQLVDQKIIPALEQGKTVITDRFVLATLAYQGHAGAISAEEIRQVAKVATRGVYPELTFLIDLEPSKSEQRRNREPDRMEERGTEYLRKVREGFLIEAKSQPDRIVVIDGSQSIDDVQTQIRKAALAHSADPSKRGDDGLV